MRDAVRLAAKPIVAMLTAAALLLGCGGAQPSAADIWHDEALRPGQVPPRSAGETALLDRLGDLPSDEPVTLRGEVFVAEAAYDAASGRRCRPVRTGAEPSASKLACESDGRWVFVPDVFAQGGR